jgi:hypothetical protein
LDPLGTIVDDVDMDVIEEGFPDQDGLGDQSTSEEPLRTIVDGVGMDQSTSKPTTLLGNFEFYFFIMFFFFCDCS